MTILEKAKSFRRMINKLREPSKEEVEFAIAWLTGEITSQQAAMALGIKPDGNLWQKMASIIKGGVLHGHVTVVNKGTARHFK